MICSECSVDRLQELRLKFHKPPNESQTWFLQLNDNIIDENDEIYNKVTDLIQYYNKMENILKLVKEKNNKATLKKMKNTTKHKNALKELNDVRQENKVLEEFISESESYSEMIEKVKQENDYMHLVYKKNVSTISRLKDEILNDSKLSFNKPTLHLNLDDDDFLGFDSVTTVTTSETQIDPQSNSYRSFYYKIQKDSLDVQNKVNSLFTVLKQTNLSIEIAIEDVDLIINQTTHAVEEIKKQFSRILKNDQEVIEELTKKRCVLEQIKLNSACHLSILESDFKSLGNRVKIKRVSSPIHLTRDQYTSWFLKKLSVQELFRIWSKMIIRWSNNLEHVENY